MIHIHTLLTRLSSTHVHKFTRWRGGGQTETSRHLKTGWSNSTHTDVVTHLAKSHQARHNTTASARLRVWMSEEKCRQILWSKPPPSPKTLIIPFSISFYWLTFSITRRWGHPKENKKKKKSEQWLYLESILKTNPCVMGHGIKGHIWLLKRWNTFKLIQTQRGARVWEVVEIAEIDRRPRGRLSL